MNIWGAGCGLRRASRQIFYLKNLGPGGGVLKSDKLMPRGCLDIFANVKAAGVARGICPG